MVKPEPPGLDLQSSCRSSRSSFRSSGRFFHPWSIQHTVYRISRYLVRSDGKTSYGTVFKKAQKSFRRACSCSRSVSTPLLKKSRFTLHLNNQRCRGWDVVIGMRIVSCSGGQILKTCTITITRLVREEQFDVSGSRSSRLRLTSHLWTIRRLSMKECSFRILFRSSFFSRKIRSRLKLKRRIPMLFILQGSFQSQQLHQPRERRHKHRQTDLQSFQEVQLRFLFNHLQDYLNLNLNK